MPPATMRDQHHRPDAGAVEVEQAEQEGERAGGEVDLVAHRQGERLGRDAAGELAVGDDGAGEGHGADEDAEKDLHPHDRELDRLLVRERRGEAAQRVGGSRRDGRRGAAGLDVGVEADENRREADEAVEARDQFGHLGHLHAAGDEGAGRAADHVSSAG